jgi:uroporphyrinogen-III decarboxylase
MGQLGCEIVDLDYFADLAQGRQKMGPNQVLLGNLDPVGVIRNQTPEQIIQAVDACHKAAGSRFVVGAGCEIVRDTPEANLRALCDYARSTPA